MTTKIYLKCREFLKKIYYPYFKKSQFKEEGFPKMLKIELSSICNGKCPMCPSPLIKRKKTMDEQLFKKIIQECKGTRLEEIHPFFYNEPFLFPQFIERLRYIRKELDVKIYVTTNGSVLTKEIGDILIKEKLVDNLTFSLDAFDSKTFEERRGLKNFDEVLKTIFYLKDKMNVGVNFTVTESNYKDLDKFKEFWKDKGVQIFFNYDDGRKDGEVFINRRYKIPCNQPFEIMTILSNGDVVLCHMDALGSYVVGNVKPSIKAVWLSKKMKRIREFHLNGERDKINLCRGCKVTLLKMENHGGVVK